jgi:hypothetical protein
LSDGTFSAVRAFDISYNKKIATNSGTVTPQTLDGHQAAFFTNSWYSMPLPSTLPWSVARVSATGWLYRTDARESYFLSHKNDGYANGIIAGVNETAEGTLHCQFTTVKLNNRYRIYRTAAGVVPKNKWTHFCIVFNADSQAAKLYLNGAAVSWSIAYTAGANFSSVWFEPNFPQLLGTYSTYLPTDAGYFFVGALSKMRLYDRDIQAAEAAALYKDQLR